MLGRDDMMVRSRCGIQVPRSSKLIDMLAIAAVWCVALAIINPVGDFPLNDDWSYELDVRQLLEYGDFRPAGWVAVSLLTHVLWGALFCIPTGVSFNALRLSTLTMSLLGILGTYLLTMEVCGSRRVAVLVALILGFCPVYCALSVTFMTDVLSITLMILPAALFVRFLRHGSQVELLTGTLLAVAATMARQSALAVPIAFGIILVVRRGLTVRNIARAAAPAAICLAALCAYQEWLAATGRLPALYAVQIQDLAQRLVHGRANMPVFADCAHDALLYLGWFLSPLLVFAAGSIWRHHGKHAIAPLTLSFAAMLLGLLWDRDQVMPTSYNIVVRSGIGPLTLSDTYIMNLKHVVPLRGSVWLAITAVSLLGAAVLITAVGLYAAGLLPRFWPGRMNDDESTAAFLLLASGIYLLPHLAAMRDRYMIPALPFLAAGIAAAYPDLLHARFRLGRIAAAALLVALALFATCGTRDYLAWNRARWQALDNLMERDHVPAEDIDGGFEFNGLHFYDPQYQFDAQKSWWWVQGDTYRIAFGPIPGYVIVKTYEYSNWMPPHVGQVLVLKRTGLKP